MTAQDFKLNKNNHHFIGCSTPHIVIISITVLEVAPSSRKLERGIRRFYLVQPLPSLAKILRQHPFTPPVSVSGFADLNSPAFLLYPRDGTGCPLATSSRSDIDSIAALLLTAQTSSTRPGTLVT